MGNLLMQVTANITSLQEGWAELLLLPKMWSHGAKRWSGHGTSNRSLPRTPDWWINLGFSYWFSGTSTFMSILGLGFKLPLLTKSVKNSAGAKSCISQQFTKELREPLIIAGQCHQESQQGKDCPGVSPGTHNSDYFQSACLSLQEKQIPRTNQIRLIKRSPPSLINTDHQAGGVWGSKLS